MIHAGIIIGIVNGEVYVDNYRNVFVGKEWIGKLDDRFVDLNDFLMSVVKEYYRKNGPIVLDRSDGLISVDGCGRIFIDSDIVFGPPRGEC